MIIIDKWWLGTGLKHYLWKYVNGYLQVTNDNLSVVRVERRGEGKPTGVFQIKLFCHRHKGWGRMFFQVSIDKLQLTGWNLGQVFISRSSLLCALHLFWTAKLKVENSAKQLLCFMLLGFALFWYRPPWAWTVKLFKSIIVAISNKAKVFATFSQFYPIIIFVSKTGAYQSGAPYRTLLYW